MAKLIKYAFIITFGVLYSALMNTCDYQPAEYEYKQFKADSTDVLDSAEIRKMQDDAAIMTPIF